MSIMSDANFISWVQTAIAAFSAWIAWMAYKKIDVNKSKIKTPIEIRLVTMGSAMGFLGSVLSFMGFSGWGMLAIFVGGGLFSAGIGLRPGQISRFEVLALVWINTLLAIGISAYIVIRVLLPNEYVLQRIAQ